VVLGVCVCVVLCCYGFLSHFLLNGMKHSSPVFSREKKDRLCGSCLVILQVAV
jgi:hypothetical protein